MNKTVKENRKKNQSKIFNANFLERKQKNKRTKTLCCLDLYILDIFNDCAAINFLTKIEEIITPLRNLNI